jgi:aspartate carbamoyltransferase catalytic subunit
MLYFTQPSTRTFLSFSAACQILGMTCNEVRDPSTSSETKGETRFDSIRMFSSYFDVIIMRSPIARLAESCAYLMNDLESSGSRTVPILNAGSGADEHPTQALLDTYTLQRSFQFDSPKDSPAANRFDDLRERKGYAGLTYDDARLVFVSPDHPTLSMREDLRERLVDRNVRFYEFESFDEMLDGKPVIEQLDALYMTRIQKEHNNPQDAASMAGIDFSRYCLTPELVARMKEYAPILHPFPRDQHFGEIPPEIDNDPRAMYFRQARNGMWIRAALLAHVFDVDRLISRHFMTEYLERHNYND